MFYCVKVTKYDEIEGPTIGTTGPKTRPVSLITVRQNKQEDI